MEETRDVCESPNSPRRHLAALNSSQHSTNKQDGCAEPPSVNRPDMEKEKDHSNQREEVLSESHVKEEAEEDKVLSSLEEKDLRDTAFGEANSKGLGVEELTVGGNTSWREPGAAAGERPSPAPPAINAFANDGSFLEMFLRQQESVCTHLCNADSSVAPRRSSISKSPPPADGDTKGTMMNAAKLPVKTNFVTSVGLKETEGTAAADKDAAGAPKKRPKLAEDEEVDGAERIRRQEFLQAMRHMEEAGLLTDKGIGAGMVK